MAINREVFPAYVQLYCGGVLGLQLAMAGGNVAAFLGLFIHYFISLAFTLFFFVIFKRVKFLSFNKYLIGMLYAVFINVMMDLILKFTPLPPKPFVLADSFISWITLGVVLGIPIAYNAYKYYRIEQQ